MSNFTIGNFERRDKTIVAGKAPSIAIRKERVDRKVSITYVQAITNNGRKACERQRQARRS